MSNYVQTTYFAPKDSLLTGNPAKLIKGADVDPELAAISAAIATKYDATNISSAPVLFNDGTVAAPGIAFAADTNTGFYRIGADNLGIATGGVLRVSVDSGGAVVVAAPSAGNALTVNGVGATRAALFQGGTNPNIGVTDGTVVTKTQVLVASATGTVGTESNHAFALITNNTARVSVGATGGIQFGAPTGGDKGAGTLNVAGNIYINNVAVPTGALPVGANPTATVSTVAVNGVATTFMRSDGAPAIDVTMSPGWSGTHTFTHVVASRGSAGDYPVFLKAAIPYIAWSATGQAADAKVWETVVSGLVQTSRVVNDAGAVSANWLQVTRAATAIASMSFGNATDNPTYSFLGTGASTFSGTVTGLSFIPTSSTVPANGLYLAAANTLGFAANSVNIARMTSTAITGLGPVAAAQVDMTPDTGTFTATYTGFAAPPTATATWYRIGKLVVCTFATGTGTSNSTALTITGIPAAIRTTTTQFVHIPTNAVEDNGTIGPSTATGPLCGAVDSAGVITIKGVANNAAWATASGVKGIANQFTISWLMV